MKWEKVKLGNVTDSCLGKMLDQNKQNMQASHFNSFFSLQSSQKIS